MTEEIFNLASRKQAELTEVNLASSRKLETNGIVSKLMSKREDTEMKELRLVEKVPARKL
jgi:hypothetical protein